MNYNTNNTIATPTEIREVDNYANLYTWKQQYEYGFEFEGE